MEVLASAYDSDAKFGNFYVYILPDDWTQPNWQRETLATNFKANNYLMGNSMTPGKHRIFYPSRFLEYLHNYLTTHCNSFYLIFIIQSVCISSYRDWWTSEASDFFIWYKIFAFLKKKWKIILEFKFSGDDDGKHYILFPLNEDKNDWSYDMQLLVDTSNLSMFFTYNNL